MADQKMQGEIYFYKMLARNLEKSEEREDPSIIKFLDYCHNLSEDNAAKHSAWAKLSSIKQRLANGLSSSGLSSVVDNLLRQRSSNAEEIQGSEPQRDKLFLKQLEAAIEVKNEEKIQEIAAELTEQIISSVVYNEDIEKGVRDYAIVRRAYEHEMLLKYGDMIDAENERHRLHEESEKEWLKRAELDAAKYLKDEGVVRSVTDYDAVRSKINFLCERKNWSREVLAEKTGIPLGTILSSLSGRLEPNPRRLHRLLDALEVSPAERMDVLAAFSRDVGAKDDCDKFRRGWSGTASLLGSVVLYYLEKHQLTSKQVAKTLDVDASLLTSLINLGRVHKNITGENLANALGIPAEPEVEPEGQDDSKLPYTKRQHFIALVENSREKHRTRKESITQQQTCRNP